MAPDNDRPSSNEEEYFAREDVEKKRKLALQHAEALSAQQREEQKKLHFMHCPKCGSKLHTLTRGSVELDTCFNCKGIWLDAGELEELTRTKGTSHPVIHAVLNIFKGK